MEKEKTIKLNDTIYHPCNFGIIEHKVVEVKNFSLSTEEEDEEWDENTIHYILKSKKSVGRYDSVRVRVSVTEVPNKLQFLELLDTEETAETSGLEDFVEGNYYIEKKLAELEFYKQQESLCLSSMNEKKRMYEFAKDNYERVKSIVNLIINK